MSVGKQGSGGIRQVYLIPGSVATQLMVTARNFHCLCWNWRLVYWLEDQKGPNCLMMWCLLFFQTSQGFLLDSCQPPALSNLTEYLVLTHTLVFFNGAYSYCFCPLVTPENEGRGTQSSNRNVLSKDKCLHLHVNCSGWCSYQPGFPSPFLYFSSVSWYLFFTVPLDCFSLPFE